MLLIDIIREQIYKKDPRICLLCDRVRSHRASGFSRDRAGRSAPFYFVPPYFSFLPSSSSHTFVQCNCHTPFLFFIYFFSITSSIVSLHEEKFGQRVLEHGRHASCGGRARAAPLARWGPCCSRRAFSCVQRPRCLHLLPATLCFFFFFIFFGIYLSRQNPRFKSRTHIVQFRGLLCPLLLLRRRAFRHW